MSFTSELCCREIIQLLVDEAVPGFLKLVKRIGDNDTSGKLPNIVPKSFLSLYKFPVYE
jgi:hypothetical protein